jgi:hypothetical protein
MIDPQRAVELAEAMRQLYADAEVRMLERVADRLERGIAEPGWAERKAAEMIVLHRELEAAVARLSEEGGSLLPELLDAAHRAGADAAAAVAGGPSFTRVNPGAVQALAAARANVLQGTHFAILRSTEDAYRAAIAEAAGPAVAGAATRREAAQHALRRFADRGISGFVDSSGRRWELGSYVEMATRTSIGQAYLEGHVGELLRHGRDLVIVSNSPDECALCRPWEGKVLSLSGADPDRPSLAEARGAGLFHASCTHTVGLYVEGLTRPLTNTSDAAGRAERDRHRELERNLRRWRRRQATAITPAERRLARAKVQEWRASLADFAERTGRRRDRGREGVSGPVPRRPGSIVGEQQTLGLVPARSKPLVPSAIRYRYFPESMRPQEARLGPVWDDLVDVHRTIADDVLDERRSWWTGAIQADPSGALGTAEWDGSISIDLDDRSLTPTQRFHVFVHEQLHHFSEDALNQQAFLGHRGWEEGVVEALTRVHREAIADRLGVVLERRELERLEQRARYDRFVEPLERLRRQLDIERDDYYEELLAVRVDQRADHLRAKADELVSEGGWDDLRRQLFEDLLEEVDRELSS